MLSHLLTTTALLVYANAQTIVDIAAGDSELSTLVSALISRNLTDTLSGTGPFTVLAPTDDAFALLDSIPTGQALTDVLLYHVIPAEVNSSDLTSGLVAPTVNGQSVTALLDNGVFFYDSMGNLAQVTVADIQASNGVIHKIDAVLIPDGTIDDITGNVDKLSKLDGALEANSLDATLAGTGPFTLFAPSNAAVDAFNGGIDTDVLTYHVVASEYLAADVPTTETPLTTVTGELIYVIRDAATGAVTVKDLTGMVATVTTANIVGSNGVVHIIDMVLEYRNVVQLAQDNADLSTLVSALVSRNLTDTLSGTGPFTVLAPTDDAFALLDAIPTGTALSNVLLYHVIGANVPSSALTSGDMAPTLQTETVTAQIDSGVFFYDSMGRAAQVTVADVYASNGVIHIIDLVLLPGGTVDDITGNVATLSSLDGALEANSLNTALATTPANYTLFAPSNTALSAFTDDVTSELLTYHVLTSTFFALDVPTTATVVPTLNGADVTVMRDANTGVVTVTDVAGYVSTVTMANIAGVNGVVHIIDTVMRPYTHTIVDIAAGNSDLSTLVGALTSTGLDATLSGTGPFTVLAPTNDAFAAIVVPTNLTILADILTYHVIAAEVASSDLSSGLVADTVEGQSVTALLDNGVFFIDSMGMKAEVTVADVHASNGVIHIIDAVLIPDGTINDITGNEETLSSLDGALDATGLDATLSGTGPFTLFAPSNAAVAAFNGEITDAVLTYHVVSGEYLAADVPTSATPLTTVNGDLITVLLNDTTGVVTVTDAVGNVGTVTTANIRGTNGVVHIIDMVLEYRNIVELAVDRSDLSTLVSALVSRNLTDTLSGTGPFTVLAPTDDAFALLDAIPSGTALSNVLTYHVIGANVLSGDLSSGLVATTLSMQMETVTAQIDSGVFFYDSMGRAAQVTVADIVGTNGVIHVINAVLLPGGTVDDITGNIATLSSLDGALASFGLNETLATTPANFTLFAPSNDAVAAATVGITTEVLTYHVLSDTFFAADVPTSDAVLATVNGEEITVVRDASTGAVTITDSEGNMAMVTMANIAGVNGVVHIIDSVLVPEDTGATTLMPTTSPTMEDNSGANAINALIAVSFGFLAILF